jgi:preprotein translocase subunit SecF
MASENDVNPHKFRHLIPPGSSFNFVSKFKFSVFLSCIAMAIGIGSLFVNKQIRGSYMNWTIDFKGGTEIIYELDDAAGKNVKPDIGKARAALKGEGDIDVSDMSWTKTVDGKDVSVSGLIVRSARYGATNPDQEDKAKAAILANLKDAGIQSANWSGDSLLLRSTGEVDWTKGQHAIQTAVPGLEVKPWSPEDAKLFKTPDPNTHIFSTTISVWGLDRQYGQILEKSLPGTHVNVVNSYAVGAKAGSELRNDAAKSLIYAIFLIMLYLAFRFDIRYAPGAAFATIHDAVMVVGVFSITWTEVSLTSVAAVLTVIGYSVNDTVIVFDRIRENQAKLKDKKLERIIDISINEMLVRTVLTSMTVFVVTLAMNVLGDGMIRNFAFAMNIGVIVGTYSSIFLAAPLFLWVSKKWYSGAPATGARNARAAAVAAEP